VDHVWTSCGLDRGSLEDVRKHFNYNHVFDILRTLSGKDTKDSSPETENVSKALPPQIKNTLLNCLSKHPLVVAAQESAKNLPIDYIKMLIAMLRSDVAQGPPGASATPAPPPAVKSNPSLGEPSSTKPDKNPVPPSETTPKEKTVPQTEKTAAKKEDNSGMPTTALIGLSVSAIALLALLCLCCCVCRAKQGSSSDVRDDKLLVNLNLSNLSGMKYTHPPFSSVLHPFDIMVFILFH